MFQRVMENLLKGIKGVIVFILIARESDRESLEALEECSNVSNLFVAVQNVRAYRQLHQLLRGSGPLVLGL